MSEYLDAQRKRDALTCSDVDDDPAPECDRCGGVGPLVEIETTDGDTGYRDVLSLCTECFDKAMRRSA